MAAEWLEAVSGWGGAVLLGLVAGLAWWRLRSKSATRAPQAQPDHAAGAATSERTAALERHSAPTRPVGDPASDVDPATGLHTGSGVVVTHADPGAGAGLAPAVQPDRRPGAAPDPAADRAAAAPTRRQGSSVGTDTDTGTDKDADAGNATPASQRPATEAQATPRPDESAAVAERSTIERALAPGQQAPAPARPVVDTAAPAVLVVDDSAVVRAMLRKLLENNGYRIVLARDGLEALAQLDQTAFALMITDLEMPNMDGVGLISALSGRPGGADLPILAITGHDDLHDKLSQFESVRGVFRKPWKDSELLGRVAGLVQQRQAHSVHGA